MISCQIQKNRFFIDKPSIEREIHYTAHKVLYNHYQVNIDRHDFVEQCLTDYLNTKKELAEHKVTCYQDTTFRIILDISFRYDEIGLMEWITMRLTYNVDTFTGIEPDGYLDSILFGCEPYNG